MNTMTAPAETVVLVDSDAVVRASLGAYLRECGLRVLEAGDVEEARIIMSAHHEGVDAILCDGGTIGTRESFELVTWARQRHGDVAVLVAGTVSAAARLASEICEKGPHLAKPYDHSVVVDVIRRALAGRVRS